MQVRRSSHSGRGGWRKGAGRKPLPSWEKKRLLGVWVHPHVLSKFRCMSLVFGMNRSLYAEKMINEMWNNSNMTDEQLNLYEIGREDLL